VVIFHVNIGKIIKNYSGNIMMLFLNKIETGLQLVSTYNYKNTTFIFRYVNYY